MNYINKKEEINVNINIIFQLINKVDDYRLFLPWCSDSRILSDNNKTMVAEIDISKNFVSWNFKTRNNYIVNEKINLDLVDGPFSHLSGFWKFDIINKYNTIVELYLEYEFDSKIIEVSVKPIFSNIMSSILDSFISEAFRLKNEL